MGIGPLQLVVVGFHGDVMKSDVLDELFAASTAGAIKLVDVLVIEKDESGRVWTSEISDLTLEEEIRYGALIGGLIGLGAGGPEAAEAGAEAGAEAVALTGGVLGLTPSQVSDLVHSLPRGHSGIMALFEHTWASQLYEAQLKASGVILEQALLEPQGLVLLGAELEAAMEAAAAVEEIEALLESEVIQDEAARLAVEALAAAGLIDAAAGQQATEVVKASWAMEEA